MFFYGKSIGTRWMVIERLYAVYLRFWLEDGYFSFAWNCNWFVVVNENRYEIIKGLLVYWGFPFLALRMLRMPSLLLCWNSKHWFLLSCTTLQNRFALWGFLEKVVFCSHLECASAANRVNVLYIVVKVKYEMRKLGVMQWKGEMPQTL